MSDWLDALTKLKRDGRHAVLITVLTARGSTPREAGCKMVVTGDTERVNDFDTPGSAI